jgi:hypothetical protein
MGKNWVVDTWVNDEHVSTTMLYDPFMTHHVHTDIGFVDRLRILVRGKWHTEVRLRADDETTFKVMNLGQFEPVREEGSTCPHESTGYLSTRSDEVQGSSALGGVIHDLEELLDDFDRSSTSAAKGHCLADVHAHPRSMWCRDWVAEAINDAVKLTTDHEPGFWEGYSAGQDVLRRDMMEILDLIEVDHIPEPEKDAKGLDLKNSTDAP